MFYFWFRATVFAFLMVRWRGEGERRGGTVERQGTAAFLCDVCCEITAAAPEETQTAQCESALKPLLSPAWAGHHF